MNKILVFTFILNFSSTFFCKIRRKNELFFNSVYRNFFLHKDEYKKKCVGKGHLLLECRVSFGEDALLLYDANSNGVPINKVKYEDICGCRQGGEEILRIFIYQKSNTNKGRIRSTLLLASSSYSTSAYHLKELQINIDNALAQANAKRFDSLSLVNKINKPFLVFVNPNSGKGQAKTLFDKHVAPIWNNETSLSSFSFKLILTSK